MPRSTGLDGWTGQERTGVVMPDGQGKHKGGALADPALGPDLATVRLNNVAGDSQTQPCTFLALFAVIKTLVKLVKDPGDILCWDALPSVTYPYLHAVAARWVTLQHG